MWKQYARKYRDGDPDNAGGGGSGGLDAAAVQAKIDTATAAATASIKALQTKNEQLIAEKKAALEKAKAFDGLDIEEMKTVHELFKNSEDAKLIKEGKIDEVLARRNEKFLADNAKKIEVAEAKALAAEAKNGKFAQRVLDDSIRAAATRAGVHKHAIDDALLAARLDFTLNDEGDPVQVKSGEVVMGKDGKTPYSPDEWFGQKAETKPHWFPTGSSGSDQGGNSGNAGSKTIKRSVYEALSPTEKAAKVLTHKIID
jgi:hypothetical protein